MGRHRTISVSDIQQYLDCPRRGFYGHQRDIPRKTDYPRLAGTVIHEVIAEFHRPTAIPRTFFFEHLGKAIGRWLGRWTEALEEKRHQLIMPDPKEEERYRGIGKFCIINYWKANDQLGPPRERERTYRQPLPGSDVWLVGRLDQVRDVTIDWIGRHRPELVRDGALAAGYDPVIIIDWKTDYLGYDTRRFKQEPQLMEEVREQYQLHEGLQATAYTWLYAAEHDGRKPIGFLWYHLRSGAGFFTYREERDFANLFAAIYHVLDNRDAQSFPKHEGRHCRRCEFLEPCREDRCFLIARPEQLPGAAAGPLFVPNVVVRGHRQASLKLRVPRRKAPLPSVAQSTPPRTIVISGELPWDPEEERQKPNVPVG